MKNHKICVLGGGSFGTVLANLAASNGYDVSLWVKDSEKALRINSESRNTEYHPELKLSSNISASEKLEEIIPQSEIIFVATPSKIINDVLERLSDFSMDNKMIVSCTKGINEKPFMTMSQTIKKYFNNSTIKLGVLSGPNLAREIADEKVAGTVIASKDEELCNLCREILSSSTFKIYTSDDLEGIELAGALKNIYAIISGYCHSLNVGENAVGLILTRSMAEMSSFAVNKGANPTTFLGLAGMGDLVATCFSKLSRNYQFGWAIGEGLDVEAAKSKVGQVAEGLNTIKIIHNEISNTEIKMPLVSGMHEILFNNGSKELLLEQIINSDIHVDVSFDVES